MSHLLPLLNEIRAHSLRMYVGTCSLSKLADFLRGYDHAIYQLLPAEADSFLVDFREWIYKRFQGMEYTWETTILMHSVNEEDAVNRFRELLDEFLQECKSQNGMAAGAAVRSPSHGTGDPDVSVKGQENT